MQRRAKVKRSTKETDVTIDLVLDGEGKHAIETPIGFLNHMLRSLSFHAGFNLTVKAKGDIDIDDHHLVEDVAVTLGQALTKALGDAVGIRRFGFMMVPMDETLVAAVVDLSGRYYFDSNLEFRRVRIGDMSAEMVNHFLRSLAENGRFNLHITVAKPGNDHHKAEATFKAVALALSQAVEINPRRSRHVPSEKGMI